MKLPILHKVLGIALACLVLATGARAGGTLDAAKSAIYFVSVKNSTVAEVHHFNGISGSIGNAGEVKVEVPLDGVETLIPIRNERMREMLFETASYPTASLTAVVDPTSLRALPRGAQLLVDLTFTLSLHGASRELQVPVSVTRLENGIEVTTLAPLVIRAEDFGLNGGIARLQEVAKLKSISTAVPVTARLVFGF